MKNKILTSINQWMPQFELQINCQVWKANKIPDFIANCTFFFQNHVFSPEESVKMKTKLK